MDRERHARAESDCAGCAHGGQAGSRREFIRGAAVTLAGMFAAAGVAPDRLAALPFAWAEGRPGTGGELTYPLPPSDSVTIDRDNELILVRWASRMYAFALSCPHQRTMLKWRERDRQFQCTKHKSKYEPDGTFVSGRATRGMDRYPIRVSGDRVLVDTARAILQDEDESAWRSASVAVS